MKVPTTTLSVAAAFVAKAEAKHVATKATAEESAAKLELFNRNRT
jgi:hypothetical protein